MRLRKIKNAGERIAKYPDLVFAAPEGNLGKWNTVFGNSHPIELEIGMGKGQFLIAQAKKRPDINFIGIELYDSVLVKAMEKAVDANLPNLKLILGDGGNLQNIFAPLEICRIYLNFSDPWPKSRHAKRRLTYSTFLETYHKLISSTGEIEFKTDNARLFEYSVMNFNRHNLHLLDFSVDLHQREEEIITTEYEDKFVALNKPIYYAKVSFKE